MALQVFHSPLLIINDLPSPAEGTIEGYEAPEMPCTTSGYVGYICTQFLKFSSLKK